VTEADWQTCVDAARMLEFVRGRATARKLRLFQVACCRRIWRFITDPLSRAFVELVERVADAGVGEREALALPYDWLTDDVYDALTDDCGGPGPAERHAYMTAGHVGYSLFAPLQGSPFPADEWQDAVGATDGAATVVAEAQGLPDEDVYLPAYRAHQTAERAAQAGLLRDLFGNPFRPAALDRRWRTADVVGLARAIYADRAFERLPVLADALMDAGCADEAVLTHCRSEGPHARGCWVVDLILGMG
jgi:hypothetical protein